MSTMYDAVDVAAIPADAQIVAGYIDGNFPTYNALVAAFPDAAHVSIATGATGGAGARVADCETGDFTPQSAAAWAKGEIEAGRRPCIYYARSNAGAVAAALKAAGVAIASVDYWVADWTGAAHLVAGSVATQWASPQTGSGGNFDISETDGVWPGAAPSPPPPPPPNPPSKEENETMVYWTVGGQNHVAGVVGNAAYHWYQAIGGNPAGQPRWKCEVLPLEAT